MAGFFSELLGHKGLIRLARALDHGVSEIFLCDFGDLLILFGLDDMGIHALKLRVDLAFRRGWGINNVVLAHWSFAWR
ncbi:hypothetical protein [Synechococcus sp. CBW1107]|uniref:hypothetical protein n=1 Tax=Synechococcus sp. CBW1107 TaxID=2789857 RepID=UPI002AD4B73B|nr:hypothetical protein [Synechococcus sp. CBW1107]